MAIISSGQITIIDLYDAPALNAWVTASQAVTQVYNATQVSYSPAYTVSPYQVLTLNLTKAGSATSLIGANVKNVKWFKKVGATQTEITSTTSTDSEYKGGTSNSVLTTKLNVPLTEASVYWTVTGIWTDPDSGLDVAFNANISLEVIQLAKAAIIGALNAPNGDTFRNATPATLLVTADLYKEGVISSGSRKYKWFYANSSQTSQDADAGAGWTKITKTPIVPGMVPNSEFDAAVTTQGTLTISPSAVINAQTFLCVITDNAGGTSGTKVKYYITLRDMDDPVMMVIESSNGSVFKNGIGDTILRARLFKQGDEYDAGGTLNAYTWTKWENKVKVNFQGGGQTKVGKTLTVGSDDVNATTTFMCEASPK